MGGLGTVQNGIAGGSIYGPDVDVLIWDSGMTEPDTAHKDLFFRQALLGGKSKIPVVWGGGSIEFSVLKYLHDEADIDVGQFGTGKEGIIAVTSEEQAKSNSYKKFGVPVITDGEVVGHLARELLAEVRPDSQGYDGELRDPADLISSLPDTS